MAYTYDDVVTAANKAGVMNHFSPKDITTAQSNPEYGMSMVGLLKDISGASTAEQRLLATEAANQMRKNYGVYGVNNDAGKSAYASSYGSTINDLLGKINGYGSFQYGNQEAYQKILDSIANRESFAYDPDADPSFSAYKKAYNREGERASANAMAQAAAASGGRTSSYAMTAAQQAGNYYAGQLADILPNLAEDAYSRYLSDFNSRLSSLEALNTDREFNYQQWMNDYNMLQNSLGNYQGQDATDYQRYLDEVNQKQQAYENALALYNSLGYATPEVAEILGISAGSAATSAGSGGASGGGRGASTDTTEENVGEEVNIDMDSVLKLGYGPISEQKLDELVKKGLVREVVSGNTIRFEKIPQKTGNVLLGLRDKGTETASAAGSATGKKPAGGSGGTNSKKNNFFQNSIRY